MALLLYSSHHQAGTVCPTVPYSLTCLCVWARWMLTPVCEGQIASLCIHRRACVPITQLEQPRSDWGHAGPIPITAGLFCPRCHATEDNTVIRHLIWLPHPRALPEATCTHTHCIGFLFSSVPTASSRNVNSSRARTFLGFVWRLWNARLFLFVFFDISVSTNSLSSPPQHRLQPPSPSVWFRGSRLLWKCVSSHKRHRCSWLWRRWASEEEAVQAGVRTQSSPLLLWTQNTHTHAHLHKHTHKPTFSPPEDKSLLLPCLFVYRQLTVVCWISCIPGKKKKHTRPTVHPHSLSLLDCKHQPFFVCLLGPV